MGSASIDITCPRCSLENCSTNFHTSDEGYTICYECGFYESCYLKKDDDGNPVKRDDTKGYEFSNLIFKESWYPSPYGISKLTYSSGESSVDILFDEIDYQNLILESVRYQNTINHGIESLQINRLVEKEIIRESFTYNSNKEKFE